MLKRLPGLRIGVFLLFVLGILSPVAATSAGAQGFTCDDFNSSAAAQAVLDADPSLEDVLDADGDGIACNEDTPVDDEETPVDEEETPVDEDDPSGSEDGDAYLADIQDELDGLQDSVDRFLEIDGLGAEATQEDVDEINQIAADWIDYPDVAAEFIAPEGLEDIEDSYLDLADRFSEAGELWEVYWSIPSGDPEEDGALEEFNAEFISAQDDLATLTADIEDAGGSTTPTEEATEEATEEPTDPVVGGDAEEYLAEVEDNTATWSEGADRAVELFEQATAAGLSDEEVDEFTEIIDSWTAAPDTAAELEAPEGYEDVQDAYLDVADEYATAADAFGEWSQADAGSPEEADAETLFLDSIDSAQDLTEDVEIAIEDAGGSTPTDDPTPEDDPTEEPDGPSGDVDAEEYLAAVSENANDWNDSVARFGEIIGLGEEATDAEFNEASEIVTSWLTAPDTAAEIEAPTGLEDVQTAYEDYADELSSASTFFTEWLASPADSPEEEEAFDGFVDALDQAQILFDDLDALLSDSEI